MQLYPYYSAFTDSGCGPVPVVRLWQLDKTSTAPHSSTTWLFPVQFSLTVPSGQQQCSYLRSPKRGKQVLPRCCLLFSLMCCLFEREYAVLLGEGRLKIFWNSCSGCFCLFVFLLLQSVGGEVFFLRALGKCSPVGEVDFQFRLWDPNFWWA